MLKHIQDIIDKLNNNDNTYIQDIANLGTQDSAILLDYLKGDRELYRKTMKEVLKHYT